MTAPEAEVLVERRGQLGLLVLNRPRALNALTHAMVGAVADAIADWRDDPAIATVAIVGSGDRGLCAGGDIVSLYRHALEGNESAAADFWYDEYRLSAGISRYDKPIVAIQDGIVLGGGIGISSHASHRIVTETSQLGLPEVGIGFVPDVGGSWLLSRAPGALGEYLALTASSVGAADAIHVGLADVFVSRSRIPALLSRLESVDADEAIAAFREDPGPASLAVERAWIDRAFTDGDDAQIVNWLRANDHADVADSISAKSPTAVAVALELVRRARSLGSLDAALEQEYVVALRAFGAPDFVEGVRAQVVDKDRSPRWDPPVGPISRDRVAGFFEAMAGRDLDLSLMSYQEDKR